MTPQNLHRWGIHVLPAGANRPCGTHAEQTGPGKLHAVLATEFINPPSRINNLLGTGVKRVTGGTDVDVEFVGQRRLGLEFIAATTNDFDFLIRRMNIGLHCFLLDLLMLRRTVWKGAEE